MKAENPDHTESDATSEVGSQAMASSGSVTFSFQGVGSSSVSIDLDRSSNFSLPQTEQQNRTLKIWSDSGDAISLTQLEVKEGTLQVQCSADAFKVRVGVDSSNDSFQATAQLTDGQIVISSDAGYDTITKNDSQANVKLPAKS